VLPITERALDPVYQAKLDRNYETGINLGKLTTEEMRSLRRDMQIVFQDPAASLDPRQTVGSAIEEVFLINTDYSPAVRREKTIELLKSRAQARTFRLLSSPAFRWTKTASGYCAGYCTRSEICSAR